MEEIRNKSKECLRTIFNKEQNVSIFEKNIYEISLKNLRKYEDLEQVYLSNVYDIVNTISKNPDINLQKLLKTIKDGKLYWKSDFYKDMIDREIEQDNFLIKPFEIEEGVLECKCGSKRVYSYSKQSRSADEPMTTYATCMACKSQWTYAG
jgi:DNA-directed RNA polymerase subunit M/transcription elongation factor TFIIS